MTSRSEDIIERWLEGDPDAGQRVYEIIKNQLRRRSKLSIPEQDVDDVAQEVFLNFLAALRREKIEDKNAYLRRVTYNKTVDYWKKKRSAEHESLESLDLLRTPFQLGSGEAEGALERLRLHRQWITQPLKPTWASQQHFRIQDGVVLTTRFLLEVLAPYLHAVEVIQNICDDVRGRPREAVIVRYIRHYSPIDVGVNKALDAVTSLKDDLIPWRKEHAQKLAALQLKEKEADIKKKKVESAEIRARTKQEEAQAEKAKAEAAKLMAEAVKMHLENEKLRLELEVAKLKLALDLINKMNPDLPEAEKIAQAVRMLPALNTITSSEIEITQLLS